MSIADIFPAVSAACAVVAAGCAFIAAYRAGRWRDSDAAKQLVDRVIAVEAKVGAHEVAIKRIDEEINELPTKADIERLAGAIQTTCAISARTESAVNRLEQFWMEARK